MREVENGAESFVVAQNEEYISYHAAPAVNRDSLWKDLSN